MENDLSFNKHIDHCDLKCSFFSAVPLGIGVMAAIDKIIFHQLLAWHHFFDWYS